VDGAGSDLALVNGVVWRPGADRPATAVRVRAGRIVAVGSDAEALDERGGSTRVVDLKGRMLLPAFTDSHTHYHRTAILRQHFLDFDSIAPRSVAAVLDAVRERAARTADGAWIEGDNLIHSALAEQRFPDRSELDSAAPAHPVLLRGTGKHVVVANSLALRLAGIDRDTDDPPGGRIERDAAGEPTGVLHERAKLRLDTTRADTVVPPLGVAARLGALDAGLRELHRYGVAAIHEITRTPDEFADYLRLREGGRLGVRVVSYVRVVEAQATLHDLLAVGLRTGYGDEWARLGGVKVSIDGSCTFRNAALYEPYPGEPDNTGIVRIDQAELTEVARVAHAGGLQLAVHAIGPRAVDMALDAFAAAAPASELRGRRHRIEHAYLPPRPGQLRRLAELGLLLSTQPAFVHSVGDTWLGIFGPDAVRRMMPLRSALEAGVPVLANSDCPTAPADPLIGIRAAVTRRTSRGHQLGTDESVSLPQVLPMYTSVPSYAAFEERSRGAIERGKLADLVVLNAPATEGAVAELAVDATVVAGEIVYERQPL
jgi:predicted amidohydrolase YtcJ